MRVDKIHIKIKNHELVLRNPEEEDAKMLLEYLKTTCGETRFLVKEPEEITMTLEEEQDFINSQNKSERNLMLLAFLDGDCFISEIYRNGKDNDRIAYQDIKRKRNRAN